jgi:hypothetical protein
VIAGWILLASLGNAIVSWVRGRKPSEADTGEKPLKVWPLHARVAAVGVPLHVRRDGELAAGDPEALLVLL